MFYTRIKQKRRFVSGKATYLIWYFQYWIWTNLQTFNSLQLEIKRICYKYISIWNNILFYLNNDLITFAIKCQFYKWSILDQKFDETLFDIHKWLRYALIVIISFSLQEDYTIRMYDSFSFRFLISSLLLIHYTISTLTRIKINLIRIDPALLTTNSVIMQISN